MVVATVHAPPAITFLHDLQPQIPTACRFTESWISRNRQFSILERGSCCFRRLDIYLAAECAGVSCVLGDFHLVWVGID